VSASGAVFSPFRQQIIVRGGEGASRVENGDEAILIQGTAAIDVIFGELNLTYSGKLSLNATRCRPESQGQGRPSDVRADNR
jgi:hypothetical protein